MNFIMEECFDDEKNCWTATVSGEVDIFNSEALKTRLLALVDEKQVDLHLDFRGLEYIDSTALGVLVAVLKHVKAYGGEVTLKKVKPNILKLFKITNLDRVFIVEGEVNE